MMSNYREIALKLEGYFARQLADHPEWEEALKLAQDWKAVVDGGDQDTRLIADRASLLDGDGSAVEELRVMIRRWSVGMSPRVGP